MQGLLKSALIAKLIPSRKTIGFDQNSIKERFASLFYRDKFNYSYAANVIERNISIIEFSLGFFIRKEQVQLKNPFIFSSESEIDLKLSNKKKNILLIPGASNISKCYPVSKFAELTKLIDANFVVIWGNKHERELAKRIVELSPLVNLSEKLSIGSLAFLISKMDLVIGPDTGPTHISWALNVPSITLFGSTPGFRNTYETSINRIIESESTVDPEKINKNDFSIKNISIHKIAEISSSLIK